MSSQKIIEGQNIYNLFNFRRMFKLNTLYIYIMYIDINIGDVYIRK